MPKELALAGVTDVEAANRYIREVYLPAHNARFAAEPADMASAFMPVAEAQWRDILCVQEERVVARDNTVAWNGQRLQIPPHPARAHFVRAKVRCGRRGQGCALPHPAHSANRNKSGQSMCYINRTTLGAPYRRRGGRCRKHASCPV